MKKIIAIVEGHGEGAAVPKLLNRWFSQNGLSDFHSPDRAVNAKGCSKLKASPSEGSDYGVERYVKRTLPSNPHGILIVIDADKECIKRSREGVEKLGPELLRRAQSVAQGVPVGVVVANRMFETWFVASFEELQEAGEFREGVRPPACLEEPESRAGHKKRMTRLLGEDYEETIHMKQLTQKMTFTAEAIGRSRSFRKLVKELRILTGLDQD